MPTRLHDLQARLTRHGYVLAVLAIAVSTAIFYPGRDDFAKGQWALLYLLIVVLVAAASGTGPALVAAALAFFAWNFFFLPPYHTLLVSDPQDWLALVAFLAVGLAMGAQTGRMRAREEQALAREHETALLNRLSVSLVSETSTETMAGTVLRELVAVIGAREATLFVATDDGLTSLCASPSRDLPEAHTAAGAAWVFEHDTPLGLPSAGTEALGGVGAIDADPAQRPPQGLSGIFVPLRTAAGTTGVLAVGPRADGRRYDAADGRLVTSLANLIAVFLERQKLQAAASRADALREADRLKSSLLSSVSHELKTPLAALTATVSNLLEGDVPWDERSVRDELRAIVDDVTRLNNSIGSLLDLSRLEAHSWQPSRERYELSDILVASMAPLPAHQRSRVQIEVPDDLPLIDVDFVQWARVFQNLIENALLYGGESTPVRIGARETGGSVEMWVEDEGPGIAADEHERIFEKFYRSSRADTKAPSGTGLGLAIALEIVKAHGGSIRVEDVQPGGARFTVSLPEREEAGE
ncbi:MAG TPA: DUF4118 domain-containing protein [Thermoleophilia bacterium]|nr:DUF4118 domain-containing protein [Thermoleophilia bacterium]